MDIQVPRFFFLHVFWNNLEYIKYKYLFLCVPDILAQGAAATHQVAGQVPDQEHERADGGRREARTVSSRGQETARPFYS